MRGGGGERGGRGREGGREREEREGVESGCTIEVVGWWWAYWHFLSRQFVNQHL